MTAHAYPMQSEIISNRPFEIGRAEGLILEHCAVSPGVVEDRDLGVCIADTDGRTIARSVWMPGTTRRPGCMLQSCTRQFEDDVHPGDIYLVDDPHSGALHILDLAVIAPVHYEGELIAWIGNAAHRMHVGAIAPGRNRIAADWHQEEILFEPTRIVGVGTMHDEVPNLFLDDQRTPRYQSLYLKAQTSANFTAQKIVDLVLRRGIDAARTTFESGVGLAKIQAQACVSQLDRGERQGLRYLDYDRVYRTESKLEIAGGRLVLDFQDADPQAKASIGCVTPCAIANLRNILSCQFFSDPSFNAETFPLAEVDIPSAPLINCDPPASCSGASTMAGWRVLGVTTSLFTQALMNSSRCKYDRVQLGWGLSDI